MKRIVIADPHPIVRKGLKELLIENIPRVKIVRQLSTAEAIFPQLLSKKPDLIILEIALPGMDGLGILKDISERLPDLKIIIYSSYPVKIYKQKCYKLGADAFIPKTAGLRELTNTVHKVLQNTGSKSGQPEEKTIKKTSEVKLSTREIEVLQLLFEGYRNKDIAIRLDLNEKTVSTYKSRLLNKLNMDNTAELIKHYNALKIIK